MSSHNNVDLPHDRRDIYIPVVVPPEEILKFQGNSPRVQEVYRRISAIAETGLAIDEEELFAYALHVEWSDEPGWQTYRDFRNRVPERRAWFIDYIGEGERARPLRLRRSHHRSMMESIGIGVGLAFGARALDLTDADFRRIPETSRRKTMDFERELSFECALLGAGHDGIFKIECKGTHDGISFARQKKSIAKKKEDEEQAQSLTNTPRVLLGTILDMQYNKQNPTHLTVFDPPEDTTEENPRHLRIIHRMTYYLDQLRVMTKGQLAVALTNRLNVLQRATPGWERLDGVQLIDWRGEPLARRHSFTAGLELPRSGKIWGKLFALDPQRRSQSFYFRGLLTSVLNALAWQDFDRILSLKFELLSEELENSDRGTAKGRLLVLPSGLVSGVVHVPWRNERELSKILSSFHFPRKRRRW